MLVIMPKETRATDFAAIHDRYLSALEHACDVGESLQGLIAQAEHQVDRARVIEWASQDRRRGHMADNILNTINQLSADDRIE